MPSSLDGAMDRMDPNQLNQDLEKKSYSTYFWRIGDGNVWETGNLVSFYCLVWEKKRKSVISTSILQVG
jgi:hypothetical protein